jgi:hypothetical protein
VVAVPRLRVPVEFSIRRLSLELAELLPEH